MSDCNKFNCAKKHAVPHIILSRNIILSLLILSVLSNVFYAVAIYSSLDKSNMDFFNKKRSVIEQIYNVQYDENSVSQ